MAVVFSNNAKTTLASSASTSATSISVVDGSVFPALSGSDYAYVTFEDTSGNVEIVKVTALSSNTLTVVRAQDNTSARAFSAGDKCELRVTAGGLNEVAAAGGLTWIYATTMPTTAVPNSGYLAAGGQSTLMPLNPDEGTNVAFSDLNDEFDTSPLTLNGNGETFFQGTDAQYILDLKGTFAEFSFLNGYWRLINFGRLSNAYGGGSGGGSGGAFTGGTISGSDVTLATGIELITQTAGANNFRAGEDAGSSITSAGGSNTFVGDESGKANTSGNRGSAFGYRALKSNTTGSNNSAFGAEAMQSNLTGFANVAGGVQALAFNNMGANNVAIGYRALYSNVSGNGNSSFGYESLKANTTGGDNVALGYSTLKFNTTGLGNVAIGGSVLANNTTGNYNTAVGKSALNANTTAGYGTAFGYYALGSNTSGAFNTAFGINVLKENTTGQNNSASGSQSMVANTTGRYNSAFGAQTLIASTTSDSNSAFGYQALKNNTTGTENSAAGREALLYNLTGSGNVAHGFRSLRSSTGSNNTATGHQSGYSLTTGELNTFSGKSSGYYITTGNKNSILGSFDGNEGGLDIRTSNNNIVLSDGDGNPRLHIDGSGAAAFTGEITANGGISLVDNKKLTFGTGDDLEVYHDGNNSYINDVGTGNLFIRGANVVLTTGAGTKYLEGGSNVLRLYHTGNQRMQTSAAGISVTGTVTATGTSIFDALDISGNVDVGGALDVTGTTTGAGYLYLSSKTANQGLRLNNTTKIQSWNPAGTVLRDLMELDANEDVRIGSSANPIYLDNTTNVTGSIKVSGNIFQGTNPATAGDIRMAATSTIRNRNAANTDNINMIATNASDEVSIAGSGQATVVGGALDVTGALTVTGNISTDNSFLQTGTTAELVSLVRTGGNAATANLSTGGNSGSLNLSSLGNPIQAILASNANMLFQQGGVTRMTIDSSGNLDVAGVTTGTGGFNLPNNTPIRGVPTSGGTVRMLRFNTSNQVEVGSAIHTMLLTATQAVKRTGTVTDISLTRGNSTSGAINIYRNNGQVPWSIVGGQSGVTLDLELDYNGSLRGDFNSTTGAYTALSLRKFKDNIEDVVDPFEIIRRLRPRTYNMSGVETAGYIYDEVDGVLDIASMDTGINHRPVGVNHDVINTYTTAAVQRLIVASEVADAKIAQLEADIQELRGLLT